MAARRAQPANLCKSITVTAPNATLADAYSAAFAVMDWRKIRDLIRNMPELRVTALDLAGSWIGAAKV